MSESTKAVFLSYASQDVAAALRICAALRAAGVEVWFDQDALVGGDQWDQKIRGQVKSCTLFVPIISAASQARREGYFRLEWKIAAQRTHTIADGTPFLLPVVVDVTRDAEALVPEEFRTVQWTRMPGGETPAAFVARVRKLLGGEGAPSGSAVGAALDDSHGRGPAAPLSAPPTAPTESSEVAAKNLELSTDVQLAPEGGFETFVPQRSLWRRALPLVVTAIAAALVAGLAVAWRLWPAAAPVTRFTLPLPEGQQFAVTNRNVAAISPDGTQMVYVANRQLYLRSMSQLEAKLIPGIEIAQAIYTPVFSPDGLSIAFYSVADLALKRIGVTGGAAVTLCKAEPVYGMSWGPDGIVFGQGAKGIMRVPPNGGAPETLVSVKTGEIANAPQMLPDGRTVLFTLATGTAVDRWDKARIVAQTAKSGEPKVLLEGGSDARYLPTGHLIYAHEGVIFAVPFDATRLETKGGPVPVVEGVFRANATSTGAAHLSVSVTGTLIYRPGPVSTLGQVMSLGFFDRKGAAELLKIPPGRYELPRVSPDGKRIAFGSDDGTIWIYDLSGASAVRRLTFDGQGNNRFPVWSADSHRVTFQSDREKDLGIFWQLADGAGAAERLVTAEPETACIPEAWSPDGTRLLYNATSKDAMSALCMFSSEDKKIERFDAVVSPKPTLTGAVFSPDGKWVAYASLRSGASHAVYVQPVPPTGAKYQISKNESDGHHPLWSPDGKELFFTPGPGTSLHVVGISTQPTFSIGEAVVLARPFLNAAPSVERPYDISRDGQRFLGLINATESGGAEVPKLQVVLNWFDELKRRAPVK